MWGRAVLQMIDDETGLRMTMAVESTPQNPRLSENNLFQIVTFTRGLGDPHRFASHDAFVTRVQTHDNLIYRLQKTDGLRRSALAVHHGNDAPVAGFAFAPYKLLRLEFGVPGAIGPEEVKRALDLLMVELLVYEQYLTGQVYRFTIADRAGRVLETKGNIYGEDYAEFLAKVAFDNHRMGIGADNR